jgi:hypothetical protein
LQEGSTDRNRRKAINTTALQPRSKAAKTGQGEVSDNHEGKRRMLRMTIATAALLLLASGAMAQEMTAAQRDACMGDYEKYCKGTAPGGGRIIACLAKQSDQLAPACKKVLAAAEKK